MTVETVGGGAVQPQKWSDFADDLDDGLEDVGANDMVLPRLRIAHKHATFKDTVTKNEFTTLNAIFLGVIKQRIMWDSDIDDNDKPQCKSPDNLIGFPQMRADIEESKQFPWADSSFLKDNFTPNAAGRIELPCENCSFQEWTRKGGKSIKPRCNEQWTMPLFYFLEDDSTAYPAVISFQRTGIKASRLYSGTFKAQRQPMFTVMSTVTLIQEARGQTDYCTPEFRRGPQTDPARWREYSEMYKGIRETLRQPPRIDEDDKDATAGTNGAAPAETPAAATTAPSAPPRKPPSAVAATALPENDPWASAQPAAATPANDALPF